MRAGESFLNCIQSSEGETGLFLYQAKQNAGKGRLAPQLTLDVEASPLAGFLSIDTNSES